MQPILFNLTRLQGIRSARHLPSARLLLGACPLPAVSVTIAGISRDSAGAPLPGCTCTLMKVATNEGNPVFTQMATTVSDGGGNYSFVVGFDGPYRVMFDLSGAPSLAGLTLKTLSGA